MDRVQSLSCRTSSLLINAHNPTGITSCLWIKPSMIRIHITESVPFTGLAVTATSPNECFHQLRRSQLQKGSWLQWHPWTLSFSPAAGHYRLKDPCENNCGAFAQWMIWCSGEEGLSVWLSSWHTSHLLELLIRLVESVHRKKEVGGKQRGVSHCIITVQRHLEYGNCNWIL